MESGPIDYDLEWRPSNNYVLSSLVPTGQVVSEMKIVVSDCLLK